MFSSKKTNWLLTGTIDTALIFVLLLVAPLISLDININAGEPGSLKWKYNAETKVSTSPAIDVNGTLYVGMGRKDDLHALSKEGKLKWKFDENFSILQFPTTPTIGVNGSIYIGGPHYNELYAINPDGILRWQCGDFGGISTSPAIGLTGTVYFISKGGEQYLNAVSADGRLKWRVKVGVAGDGASSPAIGENGTIFIGGGYDNHLYAINPDGSLKWKYGTASSVYSSPAIGEEGTIYVGSRDNHLYAINPDGSLKWRFETKDRVYSSPAIGEEGTIYVGSRDNHLYAINPDGSMRWRVETGNRVDSSPAVGQDGTVYVGSWDNHLYAINPKGSVKWKYEMAQNINSSPVIGKKGIIYVSAGGTLYAIEGGSGGPANSPWPMFGQNPRHTSRLGSKAIVRLTVNVNDNSEDELDAEVYLDGTFVGSTDSDGKYTITDLAPGGHDIKVKKEGYLTNGSSVSFSGGGVKTITLTLEKENSPPKASFDLSPQNPKSNQEVTVNLTSSDPDGTITSYNWTFGDGSTSSLEDTNHSYSEPGTYTVELTVEDEEGATATAEKEITIQNRKPTPSFTYSPKEPETGEEVSFDATQSTDRDGEIVQHEWAFGDVNSSSKENPTHKYLRPGTYTIELTIVDDEGATATTTKEITVKNKGPKAVFELTPREPKVGQEITFDATSSTDPDGSIEEYKWTFGDGSTSTSESPTHQYSEPGTYNVKLTVTDDEGATDTLTKKITVENRKPKATFTYLPKEPKAGQQITLVATSSSDPDGSIESYQWDLTDDGSVDESGSKITHIYDSKGNYTVELTVTDDHGKTSSTTEEISVSAPPEPETEVKIEDKYGLVVGISDYKLSSQSPELTPLEFPSRDAQAFYELLVDDSQANFPKANVTLLTDKEATKEAFDSALAELVTEANEDDLVVIYYSGHGAQGPDYNDDEPDGRDEYYVTYDTDPTTGASLYKTGYRDDEFADRIKSISSNQVAIFLDSCYAGGATKSAKGFVPGGQKPVSENSVFTDFKDLEGEVLFAASQENQFSYEPNTPKMKEKLGHGVFTYYLLKGLKGEADTDQDGTITIEELRSYISPRVEEFTEEHFPTKQTPLVKGGIVAPIIQREGKLEGEVESIVGSGEKASQGDYLLLNLGNQDGVRSGDQFKVFLSTKAVDVIETVHGRIKVQEVVGPHLSLAKIVVADFTVESGFKVEKIGKD